MAAHLGSGIVLRTYFDNRKNKVLRTIFDKGHMYYQSISDYVPPLFLSVNYEEAAFTRPCFTGSSSEENNCTFKTDDLFQDNIRFLLSLLSLADCCYDACQVTFLRLETVGDFQRVFQQVYPLWSVGVGALVRLTFSTWFKRNRALKLLASNAANNHDVYAINYAANCSTMTILDYLEPLFAHCSKMAKANGQDIENWQRTVGLNTSTKKLSLAAAINTTEMFEINYCVIDEPPDVNRLIGCDSASNALCSDYESAYSCSSTVTSKRTCGSQKKRNSNLPAGNCSVPTNGPTTDLDLDGNGDRQKSKRPTTSILEKQRAMCGPLTVHDVRPFFSMLNAKRLSRLSLDQLEELPVVAIRCEQHFCAITCCVTDRTDKQPTVMHVYYCWDESVHVFLQTFATSYNAYSKNNHVLVAVSQPCSEDIEARLRMLEDLKKVIWKDNTNTYVRLAINEAYDEDLLARNFYEPLVFRGRRHAADLETEIKCSLKSCEGSGSTDMFRNSISLDCARLCNDLDPTVCKFARAYHCLLNDSSLSCNGSIRIDQQSIEGNAELKQNTLRLMEHRQNQYAGLVLNFRSERILEIAFSMASELRLGLLDVFGLRYTDPPEAFRPQRVSKSSNDDLVFDSLRASNYVFVETLIDSSLYFGGACGSVSSELFVKENGMKPLAQFQRGMYRNNIIEFDLKSAYPTVAALYNISPETTAIVERQVLKKLNERLEALTSYDSTFSRQPQQNVMTCVYNQIGHVNDVDSNFVIVSLKPEIYVGSLARLMERLVLKRKNKHVLMNLFYKKLANVIYGCTDKSTSQFNDLLSPQCASAIRSLCKSVMSRTLQNLPQETILLVQTDGALVHTGSQDTDVTRKELEIVIRTSIDTVVTDVGNVTTAVRLEPRIRKVDFCLVIDQNRQLILYTDGKTISKGQDRQPSSTEIYLSHNGVRVVDTLLPVIARYLRDNIDTNISVAIELNNLLHLCITHLSTLHNDRSVDWFTTARIPTTNERMYNERNQVILTKLPLRSYTSDLCQKRLVDTSTARFGDKVAIWPVLVCSNGESFEDFRISRPSYNSALRPGYVFIMKNFLRYWVKWVFTIRDENHDETKLMSMFHAICKKYERDLIVR